MYYNSNKDNNNYYNSYKKEISEKETYRRKEFTQKIIKLTLSLLILILFIMAAFYLYKYFNPTLNNLNSSPKQEKAFLTNKLVSKIVIKQEELPKSIQSNNTDTIDKKNKIVISSMNEKDIELIVEIIMSQMNTKVEKSLEEQLQEVNNKKFINKNLEEENHYNKVVLIKDEVLEVKNSLLVKLSTNLNNIINEEIDSNSNYTQEITKEVLFRENEMRIIIVQNGDTLSKIAKKAYGDDSNYRKIFAANPEIIKNPNQIFVGQRLRIPS